MIWAMRPRVGRVAPPLGTHNNNQSRCSCSFFPLDVFFCKCFVFEKKRLSGILPRCFLRCSVQQFFLGEDGFFHVDLCWFTRCIKDVRVYPSEWKNSENQVPKGGDFHDPLESSLGWNAFLQLLNDCLGERPISPQNKWKTKKQYEKNTFNLPETEVEFSSRTHLSQSLGHMRHFQWLSHSSG